MNKYKFTKKADWWEIDHQLNFDFIKQYFMAIYIPFSESIPSNSCESSYRLSFLEIGVFEGRTSVWLLDNILEIPNNGRSGILHCIEPNLTKNGKFNLKQHMGNIILHEMLSVKALISFIQEDVFKFDFIYVDGDHNACGLLEDLVLSWKLLKVEGIMLIDDYEMETTDPWHYKSHKEFNLHNPKLRFTHPRIAIDAFLGIYRGQFELIIDNYQIGIKKIINLSQ